MSANYEDNGGLGTNSSKPTLTIETLLGTTDTGARARGIRAVYSDLRPTNVTREQDTMEPFMHELEALTLSSSAADRRALGGTLPIQGTELNAYTEDWTTLKSWREGWTQDEEAAGTAYNNIARRAADKTNASGQAPKRIVVVKGAPLQPGEYRQQVFDEQAREEDQERIRILAAATEG